MRKTLLIWLLLSSFGAIGQQLTYEYSYDNAGNRVRRAVVQLNSKGGDQFTDLISYGVTMTLYPNPTQGSVRFALSGDGVIERYILSDMTGRILEDGSCVNSSMTLDLSARQDGMYLLDLFIDGKRHIYKVIKQ